MLNKTSRNKLKTTRPQKSQLPKIKSTKNVSQLIFSEDEINNRHHYEFLEAN